MAQQNRISSLREKNMKLFVSNILENDDIEPEVGEVVKKVSEVINEEHEQTKPQENKFFATIEQFAYKQPWNRLNGVQKTNKLNEYLDACVKDETYTQKERDTIYKLLEKAIDEKLLNTKAMVVYDPATEKIVKIPGLKEEKGKYTLKTKTKKVVKKKAKKEDD